MNLYSYFRMPNESSLALPLQARKPAHAALAAIASSNLPFSWQEKLQADLLQALNEDPDQAEAICADFIENTEKKRAAQKLVGWNSLKREWADFFLAVPLWIAVDQVFLPEILDPFLAHEALPSVMTYTLTAFLSACGVYLIIKFLIVRLARISSGARRPLYLACGLIGVLACTLLSQVRSPGIQVSPAVLLALCAVCFVLALSWHRNLFDPEGSVPHIS